MRVSAHVGPTTVAVEAPQGREGRDLIARLRAAMVAAEAVDKVITEGPAIPEGLYASPASGMTTQEMAARARAWLGKVGCEVVGVVTG